jgi:hypothetical protein
MSGFGSISKPALTSGETALLLALKQDAATAATDTELASEISARGTAVSNEVTARIADVDVEEAARIAADVSVAATAASSVSAEAVARAAADALKQDASTAATDSELSAAVAAEAALRTAADVLKQDASTAATDAELAAGLALKQDASTAATDAEVTAAVAAEAALRTAADTVVAENTQTADYTLVLSDAGKSITVNSASAKVITVPVNASVAFPVGTIIEICRYGAGSVTIHCVSGTVTIPNRVQASGVADRTIANQMSTASLRKRATDEWVLVGDIA